MELDLLLSKAIANICLLCKHRVCVVFTVGLMKYDSFACPSKNLLLDVLAYAYQVTLLYNDDWW